MQHDGRVGQALDHAQVVADEEHTQPARRLQADQQVQHLRADRDVERCHRLVADQDRGPARQRPGDGRTLQLTAGKLGRVTHGQLGRQAHGRHQLVDLHQQLRAAEPLVELERQGYGLADAAARVEARQRILEHHLDGAPGRPVRSAPARP